MVEQACIILSIVIGIVSDNTSARWNCEKPYRARSSPSKVINLWIDRFVIEYEEQATMFTVLNIAFFLVEFLFFSHENDTKIFWTFLLSFN